ncbi:CaiB/BaiF CoA transferase family protein [Gottfriedia sp. NPDC056225]|uniref:CaiB/BaiF CoA transferase family protein n=1 Tax=Gottfriedia sp. NPDC056225 TaxID=3345751 RepID=UPI0035D7CE05
MFSGVLNGIRILDISTVLAAPLASNLLGDFGAEIIKIEQPGKGDASRNWGSNTWKVTNRNKKCITLDFHKKEAVQILYKLVQQSDAIITNFRPETLRQWKIDYEDLIKVKPDLVMLHFSAFGRSGPRTEQPGFARVAEGFSGLMNMTGYPDDKPMPSGFAIADGLGGVYSAFSIMLALYHYKQTGEGQLVDLSLYEPLFRVMEDILIDYDITGNIRNRVGTHNPGVAPNDLYLTKDNHWVILPASTENMFKRLMQAIGHDELIEDSRFCSNALRVKHRDELDRYLKSFFSQHTYLEVDVLLDKYKIAHGPVYSIEDIINDSHYLARENVLSIFDSQLNKHVKVQGIVPTMSKTPGQVKWLCPEVGAHNEEIYINLLGFNKEKVNELRALSII